MSDALFLFLCDNSLEGVTFDLIVRLFQLSSHDVEGVRKLADLVIVVYAHTLAKIVRRDDILHRSHNTYQGPGDVPDEDEEKYHSKDR